MTGWKVLSVIAFSAALATGCGRRSGSNNTPDGDSGPGGNCSASGVMCVNNTDCCSGLCGGGLCAAGGGGDTNGGGGTQCTDHGDCGTNDYCHFPSTSPWVAGTEGVCSSPCMSNQDCSIGQECDTRVDSPTRGRCFTNVDCNPANSGTDCPPGEVCAQSGFCTMPPVTCYFNDQCPAGWLCNVDNTCADPNDLNLGGGCMIPDDCNMLAACAGGTCDCIMEECVAASSCSAANPCPSGQYCAAGTCQPSTDCSANPAICDPYGLVCDGMWCADPQPCDTMGCPMMQTYCCSGGLVCNTNTNPPTCLARECTRDDQCAVGEYCDLFTSSCETGCGDDDDCPMGQYCQNDHTCGSTPPVGTGASCDDDSDCASGEVCAPVSEAPPGGFCAIDAPAPFCVRECAIVCDKILNLIQPTCPNGTVCGVSSGDPQTDFILLLFELLFGGGTTSACVPA